MASRAAAVRGRARRVPRLRPRPAVRAAAVDRARGPAPAGPAARAARLGDRVGPADAARRGSRRAGGRRRHGPDARRRLARPRPGRRARPRRGTCGSRRRPCPARRRHRRADPERPVPAAFAVGHVARGMDRRRRGGARGHRAGRDLPGEPHPPARGAVRAATRGRCSGGCGPATRRCSRATWTSAPSPADRHAAGAALAPRPEPFLAVDADGTVSAPTRSRAPGRAGRTRDEDRALARELLASPKDQAENVMIVDVLRNDLGRVCEPGSRAGAAAPAARADGRRPAPRDHGDRPAPGGRGRVRPARGRVPRRLDHRRAEDPRDGADRDASSPSAAARTAARWRGWGRTAALGSSILIRTFVADGERLTLHVGGGITWRSDPQSRSGTRPSRRRAGRCRRSARSRSRDERGDAAVRLGRRRAAAGRASRRSRCSTAGSSWATGCSRRSARAAAG